MKKAILTPNYNNVLCNNTRLSRIDAAERWGAEYCEFTLTNHPILYHPATVKVEAFTIIPDADAIFIVDADAIIRSDCPSPFDAFPVGKVSVVDVTPRVDPSGSINASGANEWHRLCKLVPNPLSYDNWRYFNSGVMMFYREQHKKVLDYAWDLCRIPNDLCWVDQTPLNYACKFFNSEMNYVDEQWNYIGSVNFWWPGGNFKAKMDAWILHFAGSPGREEFMEYVDWKA